MRIASFTVMAVAGIGSSWLATPADAQVATFHVVSVSTKECLSLRTPDAPGGGGLELKPCQPLSAVAFSLDRSTTAATRIAVTIGSGRAVCVVATDEPGASLPTPLPVTTVECGGRDSLWFHSGPLDQHVFRKADRTEMPMPVCLQTSPINGAIELDVCQAVPRQRWELRAIKQPLG